MSVIGRATPFLTGGGAFNYVLSAAGSDRNLRSLIVAAGWDQTSAVTASITANQNGSTGVYISGSFPGGLTVTNTAVLYGNGGPGGGGGGSYTVGGVLSYSHDGDSGTPGGTGLAISGLTGGPFSFINNGVIASGGGGGGGGNGSSTSGVDYAPLTGGGGGQGGTYYTGPSSGAAGAAYAGDGGAGGAYNTGSGADGTQNMTGIYWTLKGNGAGTGYAVNGIGNMTFSGSGSIYGPTA